MTIPSRDRGQSLFRCRSETCFEVSDEILRRLEPNGQPQHAIRNPELRACLRTKALVGRRCRVSDETLCVAQIVGDSDEPQRIDESEGPLLSADDLEGHHLSA